MMKRQTYLLIVPLLFMLPSLGFTNTHYGASISVPLMAKEPPNLHGYQFLINYDPQRFKWRKFNIYFDGGFGHFRTNSAHNTSINVYSIAPVVRYTFRRRGFALPYLELSIGLSYLNHTRLDNRNLGMHFAFQDRMGIGALLGASERFSFGVHAMHYSNAHLSEHNSGITIPLVVDVGYRF